MTSDERLAIAEEILSQWKHGFELAGIKYTNHMGACWNAWMEVKMPTSIEHVEIASHPILIDCIHLARQKLAAEREAAMTPNERKYKAALEEIIEACGYRRGDGSCELSTRIAKQALKETP